MELGSTTNQENQVSKACTLVDTDSDNIADVGEIVSCTLSEGTDNFYVIEEADLSSASTIQMLTEKNIHTTEYRQSDDAGIVKISSISTEVYDETNDTVKPIVDSYVNYLNTKLTIVSGTLLTANQAESLGCITSNMACGPGIRGGGNAPAWVYSSDYWTSSYGTSGFSGFWVIFSNGAFGGGCSTSDCEQGVRPVITISSSEIQ